MFYRLRLKLTLINVTVIFLLFLLLISGTYYFSHRQITQHSELFAQKIMHEIKIGMVSDLPVHYERRFSETTQVGRPLPPPPLSQLPPPGPNFFFIRTTPAANITFQSTNQPLPITDLTTLVKEVLQNEKAQGVVKLGKNDFLFLKSFSDNPAEIIIVFQDFRQENNMLDIQLTALIITGLTCLILSFLGSFLMANRALAPIQMAWQQQKDFLSDASHELRTPLAVIQTNLDIVLENRRETVASQLQWLQNVKEESAQMAKLVDSLLFLARTDSHQQMLDKQPFPLTDTVTRTLLPLKPFAANKNVSLKLLITDTISDYVGDETRIKQVIGILLDNAIRHTPAGGNVTLELSQTNTSIQIVVADSGEGIPAECLDKIFNRFYQVDKARSNGGAGLGLAIAKWIIETHDGVIEVNSTLGFGTTFTITLPK